MTTRKGSATKAAGAQPTKSAPKSAAKAAAKTAPKKGKKSAGAAAAAGNQPSVAERARKAVARNARQSGGRPAVEAPAAAPAEDKLKRTRTRTKSPFNRRSLAPLRATLLTMRTRLVGDIDLMGREALRADEPDVDAENVADHGSDAFERHITLELMENEARTVRQINQALDLMDGGTYGLCAACNEPIPLARLQALPFAENCIACQTAQESQY
jgi:DnaK suppressor protein